MGTQHEPRGWKWALAALLLALPALIELARPDDAQQSGFWLERAALRGYGIWSHRVLSRGTPEVVRGRDDWLFHRQGLRYLLGESRFDEAGERAGAASLRAVEDFAAQLSRTETELLIVLVPTKSSVYGDKLGGFSSVGVEQLQWVGLDSWKESLAASAVDVLDLTETLRSGKQAGETYLRGDTHWTPFGVDLAVAEIARRLEERDLRLNGSRERFDHRAVSVEIRGDLETLRAAGNGTSRGQAVSLRQVVSSESGRSPMDRSSPLLVLGDSFTLAYSDPRLGLGRGAGLAERLADAVGHPVDVIAAPGGSASQVRRTLASRPSPLSGKTVVVWQIAARDLLRSRDGWALVDLRAGAERPQDESDRSIALDGEVELELLEHRFPASLDYADCLALLPFRVVGPQAVASQSLVRVAFWGWLDFEAEPILLEEPGLRVRTRLEPMAPRLLESTCWMGEAASPVWRLESGLAWRP